MNGAIVNPAEIRDAGGVQQVVWRRWMIVVPSRSDSWACHGLLGSLSASALAAAWGKKLGLVAFAAAVLPCTSLIHLSSLTNSDGLAPEFCRTGYVDTSAMMQSIDDS